MTLVPAAVSGFPQHGVEVAEVGINITKYEVTYAPEFKDVMLNFQGEKLKWAIGAVESKISVEGEVLATASAPMTHTFYTACTLTNDIDGFGQTAGIVLLDSVTISQGNTAWRSFKGEYSRNSLITAV